MSHLNPEQIEQLKEIGIRLRQLRQKQSIPIEAIATKTYISLRLLKALEEGQIDVLPEPVFIRGFIRRYADALGLDGNAFAKDLMANVSPTELNLSSKDNSKVPLKAVPVYVPVLVIGAIAIGLFYTFAKQGTTGLTYSQNSLTTQPNKLAKPVPSFPAAPPPAQPSVPIKVTVNLKAQSSLRVVADGKTQFDGVLKKGNRKTWTAKKQLKLKASNGGAVFVSFNQQKPKLLGNANQVKEITFKPVQRGRNS